MLITMFIVPFVILGVFLVLIAPVLARLTRRCEIDELTPEWLQQFSVEAYYPMQGLLSKEDFHFLARQPGFDLSLYRKLRKERLLIFHQYLNRLISDFNRLHTAARMLVAQGQQDQSDLMVRLFKLKFRFSFSVLQCEAKYYCCRLGMGTLTARKLIIGLQDMSAELKQISALSTASLQSM